MKLLSFFRRRPEAPPADTGRIVASILRRASFPEPWKQVVMQIANEVYDERRRIEREG